MIGLVARRTASTLLGSASTWIAIAVLSAVAGYHFLVQLEAYLGIQDRLALQDHAPGLGGWLAARFLAPLSLGAAVVAPLLALRAFLDERRRHLMPLWLSAPVSNPVLVAGKFLGVLATLAVPYAAVVAMPLLMRFWVPLDIGSVLAGAFGLALLTIATASAGLYFSTLSASLPVAAVSCLALIGLLWSTSARQGDGVVDQSLRLLSPGEHLAGFFQGYVQTGDVLWFLCFTAGFLGLAVLRVERYRQRGH